MRHTVQTILVCLILTGMSLLARAAPQLALGTVTLQQGDSAWLPLTLSEGTAQYAGVNAILRLPDGIAVSDEVRLGSFIPQAVGGAYAPAIGNTSTAGVFVFSATTTGSGASGTLMELQVQTDANMPVGRYAVEFDNAALQVQSGLSNPDGSQSLEHTTLDGSVIVIKAAPVIAVKHEDTDLPNGSGYVIPQVVNPGSQHQMTFTIENSGMAELALSGTPDAVSILDDPDGVFSVSRQPDAAIIGAKSVSTFEVTFAPLAATLSQATFSIESNDVDETPYTFTITGNNVQQGG